MEPNMKANLIFCFRKTGIVPLNKQMVIQRLLSNTIVGSLATLTNYVSDTFQEELRKQGEEVTKSQEKKKRQKRLNITAWKSILASDVSEIIEKERKEKRMSKEKGKTKEKRK